MGKISDGNREWQLSVSCVLSCVNESQKTRKQSACPPYELSKSLMLKIILPIAILCLGGLACVLMFFFKYQYASTYWAIGCASGIAAEFLFQKIHK